MSLDRLSANEVEVVRQCLHAAVDGPFFPEWEFQTLMGFTRQEVAVMVAEWPACTDDDSQAIAVNNVLNNLLGYPHGGQAAWSTYIAASIAEVSETLARWRGEEGFDTSARGYVKRLR